MKQKIHNGAELDLLTNAELAATIAPLVQQAEQERARGVSMAEFRTFATPAGGNLALPTGVEERIGPQPGYAWRLMLVSADGLATADTIKVYRSTAATPAAAAQGGRFLGTITATSGFLRFGRDAILRGQQNLFFIGTGLTATVPVIISGDAEEVAESDLYKPLNG